MRIKTLARRVLATALILTMVGESFAIVNAADADPSSNNKVSYVGYEWQRIRTYEDLKNFYVTDKNNASLRYNAMDNFGTGTADDNENHWFRALIAYSDYWDSEKVHQGYFISGIDTCQDGESYKGRRINPQYGIQLDADTFVTNSGLNTPYIKYCNDDPDNDCPRFYLRFSSNDKLGTTMGSLNISWYGIAYHAAAYGEWGFPSNNNPGESHKHNWAACSASSLYETTFRFAPNIRKHFEYYCKDDGNALAAIAQMTDKQLYALVEGWNSVVYEANYGFRHAGIAAQLAFGDGVSLADMEKIIPDMPKNDHFYDYSVFTKEEKFSFAPFRNALKNYGGDSGKDAEGYATADQYDVTLGYFEAFYNVKGVVDRHWCHPDNDYEIEMCKYTDSDDDFSGRDGQFMLFLGQPHAVPVVIVNTEIVIGSTRVYEGNMINNGITVRIPKGATLQIRGNVFNNGTIIVDGGTLIVSGQLDTQISAVVVNGNFAKNTGDIIVQNGGMVVVEEPGSIIQRSPVTQFTVSGYSSVNIEGAVVTPAKISVTNSTLRTYPGSVVATGYMPTDAVAPETFGRANIKKYQNNYLSDFGSDYAGFGAFTLDGGSAYLYGLFYSKNVTVCNSGYLYTPWQATNINAQIKDMMKQW